MLNLLAISYHNIGPFKDQTISLFFEQGNYLIKAPIGTGKSFLFFDGPTYALYKSSTRNILNIQSKTGVIKLLFEVDGQCYFIIRTLKQGKSRDSTASQLFSCPEEAVTLQQKIKAESPLSYDQDIELLLQAANVPLEEFTFKNETDLQQQLNQLLPPQEVFVSTIFLLQDAENIFEMQPAQRLEVLKHVFWLLGIDESKEIVKDKRNEVKFQIKAYQESSSYEKKLSSFLQALLQKYKSLTSISFFQKLLPSEHPVISELEMMQEKLSIQNFSLDESLKTFLPALNESLETQQAIHQQQKTEYGLLSQQEQKLKEQSSLLQSQLSQHEKQVIQLNMLLSEINAEELSKLKAEKSSLLSQQQTLESQAHSEEIQAFIQQWGEKFNIPAKTSYSLLGNRAFIQELLQLGVHLKQQNDLLLQQLTTLKEKEQSEISALQQQIKALQEQESFFSKQETAIAERLEQFDQQTSQDEKFDCSELSKPCPFVRLINQRHFQQREEQKKLILEEQQALQNQISTIDFTRQKEKLTQEQEQLRSGEKFAEQKEKLQAEQTKNGEKIQILRDFLQSFDYKELETASQKREQLSVQLSRLEKDLHEQETRLENREKYQQEKSWLQSTIESLKTQISSLSQESSQILEKKEQLEDAMRQLPLQELAQAKQMLIDYEQTLQQLDFLINEWNELQLKIKHLTEEEKILGNLYTILNKELLLFVLSEYLPVLSEIINAYLASVVDYTITIKLKEESEKLELETKIIDEKGERDVKSLSGWQRTILKLVRMLAISSYLKTEMLFLDETVNNLDAETVGKVAQLLQDFVKQRKMKFYTITHNSEIQAMSIWNEILEIEKK